MKNISKGLFVTVLLVGASILLWQQFERLPLVQHEYPTNQPQAAAMQLLQQWQKETRRVTSATDLFPLPDTSTLLIIERHQGHLPPWQQQALFDWVESGGRLLINALPLDDDADSTGGGDGMSAEDIRRHDPLAYYFGVTSRFYDEVNGRQDLPLPTATAVVTLDYLFRRHCIDVNNERNECNEITCGKEQPELQYAWLGREDDALQLDLEPRIDLLHRDLFERVDDGDTSLPASHATVVNRANNGAHDLVLQLAAGAGEVWIFSSLDIFANDRLHHLDHAQLLQQLSADRQQAWWIQSISAPPLSQWLWQRGWPLISALLLLLLVFLWQRIPRRGVILHTANLQHQDFTDHLRACSALLWRIGQRRQLLEPLRRKVRHALLRHPGGGDPQREMAVSMALSGLSEEQVQRALNEIPENETALMELVALLQHLRRCI